MANTDMEDQRPLVVAGQDVANQREASDTTWGWTPVLVLTSAVGLLLHAVADDAGRAGAEWGSFLFWAGMVILFLPTSVRLLSTRPARRERIAVLVALTTALYLVKVLQYPNTFSNYDEFLHWRSAQNMLASGHLFDYNPLLPVSPYFPGLEITTTAVSNLTNLSLFTSGTVVIGVAHLLLVLGVYLLFEHVSKSPRVAGMSALLYMANTNFVFFTAMFAYESLALPLAVMVVFTAVRGGRRGREAFISFTVLAALGLAATATTHHATSYLLIAFLILWTVTSLVWRDRSRTWLKPAWLAFLGLTLAVVWTAYTWNEVGPYLGYYVSDWTSQVVQLLLHHRPNRQLFADHVGEVVPFWEQITYTGAQALTLLLLPLGLWHLWRRQRWSPLVAALGIAALLYPLTLVIRLVPTGLEIANRLAPFAYVPLAYVLAIVAVEMDTSHLKMIPARVRMTALVLGATVMLVGGVIGGTGPAWSLLPGGRYLVGADIRSVDLEGIAAAQWARARLGTNNRVATDRVNQILMGTYGRQQAIGNNDNAEFAPVFFSARLGQQDRLVLQEDQVQYLVIDLRLSMSLPSGGIYVDDGEPNANKHTTPISRAALTKFDTIPDVSRLFDSGNIVVYDVGAISDEG